METPPKVGSLVTGQGMIGIIFRVDNNGWTHISWSSEGGRHGST